MSWTKKAGRLANAVLDVPSGGRLLRIEQAAAEQGLSPQTAHHLLRAHGFLEHLRAHDPELFKLIEALPYQSVMALERWYDRDRAQMLEFLDANPAPSVRKLTAAEKQSRGFPSIGTPAEHAIDVLASEPGPLSPGQILTRMMTWARTDPFDLHALKWERETEAYAYALGIEFHAKTPDGGVAGLLVGPTSQTSGHFQRHAKSVWCNAVCASTLFPIVIMLLPSKAAQAASLTSMPLPPNSGGGWPDWNARIASRGQPKSGPIRPASPAGGIIMLTTPETICDDWRT